MTSRFIDQIDILLPVNGKAKFHTLWARITNMEATGVAYLPTGWSAKVVLKHASKLVLLKRGKKYGAALAAVELGTSPKGKKWLKLRCYPQNYQGTDFLELQKYLKTYFGYSYSEFFNDGRISRLDVAVDCSIFSLANSLPTIKAFKKSHRFKAGDGLGALYLGSPTALRVYDKKKQLAQKKNASVPYKVWTRFERVLRNVGYAPAVLVENLVDPFTYVRITLLKDAKAQLTGDPRWLGFLVMCECEGVPTALGLQPPARRLKFMKLLAEASTGLPVVKPWSANLKSMIDQLLPTF